MPRPIPQAIAGNVVSNLLGGAVPNPLILLLAVASHFGYGGLWGAVLAILARPVTIWKGIGLGIFLWFIMQIVVLPLLGWGFFGVAVTPLIAVATLILHLVYGAVLGWLMDREK